MKFDLTQPGLYYLLNTPEVKAEIERLKLAFSIALDYKSLVIDTDRVLAISYIGCVFEQYHVTVLVKWQHTVSGYAHERVSIVAGSVETCKSRLRRGFGIGHSYACGCGCGFNRQ